MSLINGILLMEVNNELIETRHPRKSKGVKIEKEAYTAVANFILRQIKDGDDVTLGTLIALAEKMLSMYADVPWLVYHVKLDLEARGFIRLIPSRVQRNTFVLRLTAVGNRHKGQPFSFFQ
ncbi:DUF6958 family protein [Chryseolinea lacunae]|uniref:Uncharacterized protein n=1 Tax=Chryseolinea lacunae TaxID=2801331 RepID=A0ABS1KWJ9_9BACT|nr:hypothetical protein [Chryseolinea lacunae]MBL0743705.1 hypothetical protein [Chryseolinea lacunae]